MGDRKVEFEVVESIPKVPEDANDKLGVTIEGSRRRARRLYPIMGNCEDCDTTKAEHRHHIDRNPHNNDKSNIAFLCASCHRLRHTRDIP